jgi:hypothetical protein
MKHFFQNQLKMLKFSTAPTQKTSWFLFHIDFNFILVVQIFSFHISKISKYFIHQITVA